jgi:hypothetical protein
LQKEGQPTGVIDWLPWVQKSEKDCTMLNYVNKFMYMAFSIINGRESDRMLDEIKPYLYTSNLHKRGDWFLAEVYTVVRLYGSEIPPYKLPKLLTPRVFALEYVRQRLNVDEIYFTKSKKKSHIVYPIALGGYAFGNHKGAREVANILQEMNLPLDKPWKYDPHFIISKLKGNANPGPNDHESRIAKERLAN